MSTEIDLFGWELLYKLHETSVETKQDVLMCFVHWTFIKHGFRCAGIGEDREQPQLEHLTESLPEGWNRNQGPYKLRYVFQNRLYLLSGFEIDSSDLLLNLNRVADEQVFGVTVDFSEIKSDSGVISQMIPNYRQLLRKLVDNLILPMIKIQISKEMETQTLPQPETYPHVHLTPPSPPVGNFEPSPPLIILPTPFPYADVGVDDLYPPLIIPAGPAGGGGGGMLFQTPGMPRPRFDRPDAGLPPDALPPGARYDPIRPNAPPVAPQPPHMRPNPDHDHLPPPGYEDMFM